MYAHLLRCSVQSILEAVCRVLPRLRADARLAGPASHLGAAYDELEAAESALTAGNAAVRDAEADRDEAGRKFRGLFREFGMVVLSTVGNHPDVQPYVLYFPEGYGDLRALEPQELIQFAGRVGTMLEKEPDPRLLSYRPRLTESCAEFVTIEERYEAALRAQADARAYCKAERRRFVRALGQARHMAAVICDEEPGYIKAIFAPAVARRHPAVDAPAADDISAVAEVPGLVGVASTPAAPTQGSA